jgi:hypothetical protein
MTENIARDYCGEALANARAEPDGNATSDHDDLRSKPKSSAQSHRCEAKDSSWPTMDEASYYGVVGDIIRTIAPHTEADPVAILVQVLVFFGNLIGNTAHYRVEADRHHANLYAVLVGQSARGRKGTSGGRARSIMKAADERWIDERMKAGLSSGEGLINEVRDEVKKWDSKAEQYETTDPGVPDKRLMITESEFANALEVMERPGNTLSPNLRNGWDGQTLSTLTKNSPLKASNPHISIVGHITEDELRARITRTDMANGFANRFLFACVRRSKLLPHGGNLADADIVLLGEKIRKAAAFAKTVGRVEMTELARREWETIYPHLSAEQQGLLGAMTARAEAQTIRLALIYALLDEEDAIEVAHLRAALAVWEYCETSVARIFGSALGDPIADEIMRALQEAGSGGMTRTAIRDLFGRHRAGDRINLALALLVAKKRARMEKKSTDGRPIEIWFAVEGG